MERGEPVDSTARNAERSNSSRLYTGGLKRGQVAGAGAENGDLLILGHLPQGLGRRVKRIAVIEHQRGPGGQGADQPVPHHPPAGGEVEDRVLAFKIGVQHQFFKVMDQDAAGALHHALGQAGGARRIHDVERMIERQLGKIDSSPSGPI
jgi:hypothetical protein